MYINVLPDHIRFLPGNNNQDLRSDRVSGCAVFLLANIETGDRAQIRVFPKQCTQKYDRLWNDKLRKELSEFINTKGKKELFVVCSLEKLSPTQQLIKKHLMKHCEILDCKTATIKSLFGSVAFFVNIGFNSEFGVIVAEHNPSGGWNSNTKFKKMKPFSQQVSNTNSYVDESKDSIEEETQFSCNM